MHDYESELKADGFSLVIGIDEAGRGPLAGPVVAAAVALKSASFTATIRDSKKISPLQREKAFHEILDNAYFGIGIMNESVIDEVNILQATFLAMNSAVRQLLYRLPQPMRDDEGLNKSICLLVDGNSFKTSLPYKYKTVVDGDALVLSIACASIIAKVFRDRVLAIYDQVYPQYGFKKHKGYPTLEHKEAIQKHGLSSIHRRTFAYQ